MEKFSRARITVDSIVQMKLALPIMNNQLYTAPPKIEFH